MRYRLIDCPSNGSTGNDCGTFEFADLPARLQAAIATGPAPWVLPALSEGDTGEELGDLFVRIEEVL